jgi:hypothetical protein
MYTAKEIRRQIRTWKAIRTLSINGMKLCFERRHYVIKPSLAKTLNYKTAFYRHKSSYETATTKLAKLAIKLVELYKD